MLGEVEADANVWRAAKVQFVEHCIQAAANRLKNRDFLKRNPQIEQMVIDRPIFIVGLPRSGTTHLENLIAADRRLRYLPVYLGRRLRRRRERCAARMAAIRAGTGRMQRWERMRSNAIMEAMHEHSPDHACGDNELQIPDFASYQWEWMADVPRWRDYYLSHDQTPHYAYGRTMLKAIAFQQPDDRRWILKGNQHSEQLPVLTERLPGCDDRHDPSRSARHSAVGAHDAGTSVLANQKQPDIQGHVAYWVDRIERMLRAYIRDIEAVPAAQRLDLLFQEVMADDVGTAQRVLEAAGLPPTA